MAKGAAWMVFLRLAVRLIGLLNTVILARLLVPEDFGLVALATMFMGAVTKPILIIGAPLGAVARTGWRTSAAMAALAPVVPGSPRAMAA